MDRSHNALYTFPKLNEIDPLIPETCIMCREEGDTLIHLFTECRNIEPFWQWIFRECRFTTELESKIVYSNNFEELEKLHFIVTTVAKCTIWELRSTLRKVTLPESLNSLKLNFK